MAVFQVARIQNGESLIKVKPERNYMALKKIDDNLYLNAKDGQALFRDSLDILKKNPDLLSVKKEIV